MTPESPGRGNIVTDVDLDRVSEVMATRPVFVVGCPRSGTTLLQLMLDSHPNLALPPETVFIVEVGGHVASKRWTAAEALSQITGHMGFARLELSPDLVARAVAQLRPPDTAAVLRLVLSVYAAAHGKKRWGEKTPIQVFYLPMLARLFPDAQFLHVIRDGRETAASLSEMWWGPHSLLGGGFIWRSAVRKGRDDGLELGSGRYLEQRLEDLVARPEQELRALCGFLAETFDESMLQYHKTAAERVLGEHRGWHENVSKPPTPGLRDWRAGRSHDEVRALEVYLRGALDEFGYPTVHFEARAEIEARAYAYARIARCSPRLIGVVHARTGRYSASVAAAGKLVERLAAKRQKIRP